MGWWEALAAFLALPWVAPVLLVAGFLGIVLEVKASGHGLFGALGTLALTLFFGSHYLTGMTGWPELMLLAGGVVLLGVEAAVPGFGFFGAIGLLSVLGSILLSLVPPGAGVAEYTQAAGVLGATLVAGLVVAWSLARLLPRSEHLARSGLLLGESTGRAGGYVSAAARPELLGAAGVAVTDLRPAGAAQIGDERLDVVAEGTWIPAGTPVEVVRADGYRHVVRPHG